MTNDLRLMRAWPVAVFGGAVLLFCCLMRASIAIAAELPLVLETEISLAGGHGRIDHLAIDLARNRLLVAELGNGSLAVVDLAAQRLQRRITGLKEPQGVAYAADTDMIFVANAGDGTVRLYRGGDLRPAGRVDLGEDADNVRVDPRNGPDGGPHKGEVIVGYGDGGLAVLDPATGERRRRIGLPAHPESFQLDAASPRLFVNLPDKHLIAVLDRDSGKILASWRQQAAAENFPMALDMDSNSLFVAFRKPAQLALIDAESGLTRAAAPSCRDADDVFLDSRRHLVYVTCGEGAIDVFRRADAELKHAARIAAPGARTSLFVPALDRLYVAERAQNGRAARIAVYRPEP